MTFLCYAKCTTCQKAKKWLVCVPVRRQKQSFLKALSEMYNKMILREYGDYQEFCENFNAIKQYVAQMGSDKTVALDKGILYGKEHRKQFGKSKGTYAKSVDYTCRNHGSCAWCESNRKYKNLKRIQSMKSKEEDANYAYS